MNREETNSELEKVRSKIKGIESLIAEGIISGVRMGSIPTNHRSADNTHYLKVAQGFYNEACKILNESDWATDEHYEELNRAKQAFNKRHKSLYEAIISRKG